MNTQILADEPAAVAESYSGRSIQYVVTGSKKAVVLAVDHLRRQYPAAGYGTSFVEPREQPDGSYTARGWRSVSCD